VPTTPESARAFIERGCPGGRLATDQGAV